MPRKQTRVDPAVVIMQAALSAMERSVRQELEIEITVDDVTYEVTLARMKMGTDGTIWFALGAVTGMEDTDGEGDDRDLQSGDGDL